MRGVGWAIDYYREAFSMSGERLMGRNAAGESFLQAVARHGSPETLHGLADSPTEFRAFSDQVAAFSEGAKAARWIPRDRLEQAVEAGVLFHPSGGVADVAWRRRFGDQRAFSIVGVTHTTCSDRMTEALGRLLTAPAQPWDALICTSNAVRSSVDRLLENWREYLAERTGGAPSTAVRLPVIPLGVDSNRFRRMTADPARRLAIRAEWKIPEDAVVFLYVGRLSFHAKANPVAMFRAVQAAAERTGRPVWLLLIGWYASDAIRQAFQAGAQNTCRGVQVAHRDGRQAKNIEQAFAVSDVFLSLVDNIQETFGLAPLEAMAAGLPVVVSDWDGYRDTVRHEVDGFRIPTTAPPPGAGEELASRYLAGIDNYDHYIGAASQCVAVDLAEAATACERLASDAELRRRLGQAGQARAEREFDWAHIVRRYEELFLELASLRREANETAPRRPGRPAHPLRDDPFAAFAGYPSRTLDASATLAAAAGASTEAIDRALADPLLNLGAAVHPCSREEAVAVVELLRDGAATVSQIAEQGGSAASTARRQRALAWMLKAGLLTMPRKAGTEVTERDLLLNS